MKNEDRTYEKMISVRRKRFFALVLGVTLALLPTVNVVAQEVTFRGNANVIPANLLPDDTLTWKILGSVEPFEALTTGRIRVIYLDANGNRLNSDTDERDFKKGDNGNGNECTVTLRSCGIDDLDKWKFQSVDKGNYNDLDTQEYNLTEAIFTFKAVLKQKEEEKKDDNKNNNNNNQNQNQNQNNNNNADNNNKSNKSHDDDNKKTEDKPVIVDPYALGAHYYKNGVIQYNTLIGRQEQSPLAKQVFTAAIPEGWHEAFPMSMSVDGKNEYSLKDGDLELIVPTAYRKQGREFAILAMDKTGKVSFFAKDAKQTNVVKVSPNIEGYAFYLIYKD